MYRILSKKRITSSPKTYEMTFLIDAPDSLSEIPTDNLVMGSIALSTTFQIWLWNGVDKWNLNN